MMQHASDQAQAALQKDPAHPEKVAAEFNMQVVTVNGYPGGDDPGDRRQPGLRRRRSAGLKKGEVSQPVACGQQDGDGGGHRCDAGAAHDLRGSAEPDPRHDGAEPRRRRPCRSTPTNWWRRPRRWAAIWRRPPSRMGLEVKTSDGVRPRRQRSKDSGSQLSCGSASRQARRHASSDRSGMPDGATLVAKVISHIARGPVAAAGAARRPFATRSRASARATATRCLKPA